MHEANINQQLADANRAFRTLFSSVPDEQINLIPFAGSWTPAQVAEHVCKAEAGMLRAMQPAGREAERDAFAGVPHLKAVFLDFTSKLKSPDMAVPEEKNYDKAGLLQRLDTIAARLAEAIPQTNTKELVTGLPTGDLTKGEIIHFLLYHTKRHIHQLQNIVQTITNKTNAMATKEEVIQKVNKAFNGNDIDAFLSYCTDDVNWNMVGEMDTTGKENIRKMMTDTPGESPDIKVIDIFSGNDKGVCTGTFSMKKKNGEPGKYYFCDIYFFREDKIGKMESYVVEMKG